MTTRLAVRGFRGAVRIFENRIDLPDEEMDAIEKLAEEHLKAIAAGELTMIEFEFLDAPDRNQAFFRIGSDPRGMVMPVALDLTRMKPND